LTVATLIHQFLRFTVGEFWLSLSQMPYFTVSKPLKIVLKNVENSLMNEPKKVLKDGK
jgi:hypothetical protein